MKTYLGDGAYAEYTKDGEMIITAENGIRATDTVVLDIYGLAKFLRFIEEIKEADKRSVLHNV